ncbi:MAG: hypothetical protein IJ247_03905 [Bacilli bacterium]|nr:hypothetical protein [Bacilli bacterium]
MKKTPKILFLSTLGLCMPLLAGCNVNGDNIKMADRLSIVYYPGGYGADYLHTLCKEFLASKNNTTPDKIEAGKDYVLQPDEDITYGADYWITSDERCPDIIISNILQPKAVTQGYISNLDDVFDATIDVDGKSMQIRDFAMSEAVEQYSFEIRRGQTDKHNFAMPWTAIPISIAYNNTILKQIQHVSSLSVGEDALDSEGKWQRAPETVTELKAIFEDCKAYNPNLAIFGWAPVNGTNWFESLISTWWAQRQGVDEPNQYTTEGSYYDFWKYDSPDIFKQTGLQDALGTIKDLLVSGGEFVNSFPKVGEMTIKSAQQAFAEGKSLFCLTGDFFEKEYSSFIEQSGQDFRMMRVPSIEGAETKDGEVKKLTFLNISSCAYVPSKALNKQLAKDFLVYTSTKSSCEKISGMIGAIRPFNYDARNITDYSSLSQFTKSVFDLYYDADDYIVKFPRNAAIDDISPIYLYEGVSESIFCGANYFTIISSLKTLTPKQIMVDGTDRFESVYSRAQRAFTEWNRLYDL